MAGEAFTGALKEALGKPREWESFNLEQRLSSKATDLALVFPVFCRPHKHAVRASALCVAVRIVVSAQVQKLWTKIIKAEKSLGWKAFVFVNLREFLPQFLPEHTVVPALQDAESSPAGARAEDTKPTGRRLDFATWLLAWRQYTPAAVATEQLELVDAVQHEQVVAEVAAQGRNDGYSPFLGVCYDEVARCVGRSSRAALMCSCVCKA